MNIAGLITAFWVRQQFVELTERRDDFEAVAYFAGVMYCFVGGLFASVDSKFVKWNQHLARSENSSVSVAQEAILG